MKSIIRPNILKRNALFFLILLPIIAIYCTHFFLPTNYMQPSGYLNWEDIIYMLCAKEYKDGNAIFLYQYPFDDNIEIQKVFFQPQIFLLGYLWKITKIDPGILITIFGILFGFFAIKNAFKLINTLVSNENYSIILTTLFFWGGGLLSLSGILLHFTYFKGIGNLSTHMFRLDPGNGWWCLNFGRSFVYPMESYYHFIFLASINSIFNKKYIHTFLLLVLLTFSHPYTSTELIIIIITWATIEYFYKTKSISKKELLILYSAFFIYLLYYAVILRSIPIYNTLSKQVALNWTYKIGSFLPGYILVWIASVATIRNAVLLKQHFSNYKYRFFFCWGILAFLLSVHEFAIKPIQPIHFTRGYVYAGFFLFSIPALLSVLKKIYRTRKITKALILCGILLFFSDNITWFYYKFKNGIGVYYSENERQLINFFSSKMEKGWIVLPSKYVKLTTAIQINSTFKGWLPHPYLALHVKEKETALHEFLFKGKLNPK